MKTSVQKSSIDELQKISGIGKVFGDRIVENRPYKDVYEISKCKGIGKKRIDSWVSQGLTH